MTQLRNAITTAVVSLTLGTGAAFAHGATQPKHGGIVATNGETLFELVAKTGGTQLYVIDDDEPVTASAMVATLSVNENGAVHDVALTSGAGNRFDGPALTLAPGAKVGVMVIDKTSHAHLGGTFVVK